MLEINFHERCQYFYSRAPSQKKKKMSLLIVSTYKGASLLITAEQLSLWERRPKWPPRQDILNPILASRLFNTRPAALLSIVVLQILAPWVGKDLLKSDDAIPESVKCVMSEISDAHKGPFFKAFAHFALADVMRIHAKVRPFSRAGGASASILNYSSVYLFPPEQQSQHKQTTRRAFQWHD